MRLLSFLLLSLCIANLFVFWPHAFAMDSESTESDRLNEELYDYNEVKDEFTRPTFGLNHKNNEKVVDYGFKINNQTFAISDNYIHHFCYKL